MKLPTFSYSAFDSHSKCPKNYKFTKRDYLCEACKKGPVPRDSVTCPFCNISFIKDAAMARGLDHHGHIEAYIKGEVDTLPPIGNDSAKICVEKLRSARAANPATVLLEKELLLTAEWKLAEEWGPIKLVVDVMILDYEEKTVQIIDWKTGSVGKRGWLKSGSESKYDTQLEFYALGAMILCPWAEQVQTGLYYLDARDRSRTDRRTWFRADLPGLRNKWDSRRKRVIFDEEFKAIPGYWCSWCKFHQNTGGPCTEGAARKKKEDPVEDLTPKLEATLRALKGEVDGKVKLPKYEDDVPDLVLVDEEEMLK